MLAPEDCVVLGIAPERPLARRTTAVSQILRALNDDLELGETWRDKTFATGDYRIRVACDRMLRRRAYALAHRVYEGRGYACNNSGLIVSPFDASPETLTLLVQDENGRDAATISLVFDAHDGLPCDEIYGEELSALRAQGRRLVEVTRLAIDPEFQRSKALLVCLFNFIYIFARRVKGRDDFVIEVNPRHVNYYCRLLNFVLAGPERACPRVQGAPAVLLRLDLSMVEREVQRVGGQGEAAAERTLYPHFFAKDEVKVAEFLARRQAQMSGADVEYFLGSRRDVTHSLSN